MSSLLGDILASLRIRPELLEARSLVEQPEARELVAVATAEDGRELKLTPRAAAAWRAMSKAAASDGVALKIVSAFRSIDRQAEIVRDKLAAGASLGEILSASAPPGYSEHHTGCAVDITTEGAAPLEIEFEETAGFRWLERYAARYGFVLSFPRGNRYGYQYEPWHWCYRPFAMHLDCGRCVVRDWAPGDKESLVRHADNRNVWRNLTHRFPHPYTQAHADAWLSMLAAMPQRTHWAIEVGGEAAGGIGCLFGEGVHARTAQFGYWLGEAHWGRGIVTAAVKQVAPYAMARFGLARLESPVFAWNPASMRVLEKCGFVREGVLRSSVLKDGRLIDQPLYALVQPAKETT